VKTVTNGGKLTIAFNSELEFPDDIVDQLNDKQEEFIVLQLVKPDAIPLAIPASIPNNPSDSASVTE